MKKITFLFLIIYFHLALSIPVAVVDKIIDHKISFDENTGEIVHIIENVQNFTLKNITIIDKAGSIVKKIEIEKLEPGEKKIVKYRINKEINLTSYLTYYIGREKHRLIPQKLIIKTGKVENENRIPVEIIFFSFILIIILIFFIVYKERF